MGDRQHRCDTQPGTFGNAASQVADSEAHVEPGAMTTIEQRLVPGWGERGPVQLPQEDTVHLGQNLESLGWLAIQQQGVGQIVMTDHQEHPHYALYDDLTQS